MTGSVPLQVWKFGGAALVDAAGVARAAALVAAHDGPLVLVASALGGITDALLEGGTRSAAGDAAAGPAAAAVFLRRHRDLVREHLPAGAKRRELLAELDLSARDYRDLCRSVTLLRKLEPRVSDALVARGERAASGILAAVLTARGRHAKRVDAVDVVATDDRFGAAAPDLLRTRRRSRERLQPLYARGVTPVVPGYYGATAEGSLATFGRGGSDLTATLLGRALGAARVVLWKDVPGILTADPRYVPDARLIPQLHRREAAEVAHHGAKVLHPRALIPLDRSRVVLEVRSFQDTEQPGTEISVRRTLPRYPVKALVTVTGQALITVSGNGMMGVPGIAARTFGALQTVGLSVSTIFQASSETSIGFTLPDADASRATAALRRAFAGELRSGLVAEITTRSGVSVLAVVGEGMVGRPGTAARLFNALAPGRVNVIAIAQGATERNISLVVVTEQVAEAARRIHDAFQLSKIGGGHAHERPRTDIVLLGFGRVGRALADSIARRNGHSAIRVVGLLDRSGFVFDPKGLSRARLLGLTEGKGGGAPLSDLGGVAAAARPALARIARHAISRPVLVDVTAEDTAELLKDALDEGFDLVLANKKPLTGPHPTYQRLLAELEGSGRRLRYEATVGAGLPIIDTYRKLVESGDRVLRVEGCVSGTLGFVFTALAEGRTFSAAVKEAMERGFTEPDPREDLSGADAARKALILARLLGYRGLATKPEGLVSAGLRRLSLSDFLKRLPEADEGWRRRVAEAAEKRRVLRYVVTATARTVRAGLSAVPADSPIGSLGGTRNLISFTTRRYLSEPLTIIGPGAGAEVTAAGILNDIQHLAATAL